MNPILYRAILASQAAAFDPDPDAVALFAAMTVQPNAARQRLISDTIVALKAAGVWSLLDAVWFMAAHDEQASRLNWKAPASFTLSEQGVITFTVDRGWQGDGSSGYLDTGWTPSVHGVNYTQNNASLGVYSRTDTDGGIDFSARQTSPAPSRLINFAMRLSGVTGGMINGPLSGGLTAAIANSLGLGAMRRTASNAQQVFRNGVELAANATLSEALVAIPPYIGARNNDGVAELYTTRQYALAFTGAAMSTTQQLALYSTTQAYMTAVGAAV
jgi:hypothetical protein